jgi:hypothetical protein
MTTRLADVLGAVDELFAAGSPRTWPAPRPARQSPAGEEYSRLLDPGKYETIQQRCRAWITALCDAGVATTRSAPGELDHLGHVETVELTPTAPGAVPAFVHFTGDHLPGVVLALGIPTAIITVIPPCGCDACDDGSEPLLDEVDNVFTSIALGDAAVEHTATSRRVRLIGGGASGSAPHDDLIPGRWEGEPWLAP